MAMSEPVVAILVAAGLGVRYGGTTPKPALRITRQALISMSIEAMAAGGCTDAVVVANPATMVAVGNLTSIQCILGALGFFIIVVLSARRIHAGQLTH